MLHVYKSHVTVNLSGAWTQRQNYALLHFCSSSMWGWGWGKAKGTGEEGTVSAALLSREKAPS